MKNRVSNIIKNLVSLYKKSPFSFIMRLLLNLSITFTVGTLSFILIYIAVKGVPFLTPSLFSLKYTSENVSMLPSIITTLMLVVCVLIISVPFGIFSAVYLVEYAPKKSPVVELIR
ncbi:MAG: phosphate ABC transporter, permease protein PstA, partial [Oscillospiraceae bacterium]